MTTSSSETIDPELQADLDHVAARTRAVGREVIASAGLWAQSPGYETFLSEQFNFGHQLRREVLTEVVGAEDASALGASAVWLFGARGQRVRVQLPYLLANAYELGSSSCALVGGDAKRADDVGRICAVFNFTGAFFDAIYDDYARWFEQVTKAFNETTLQALLSNDGAATAMLARHAGEAKGIEVRLLLKAIAWSVSKGREVMHRAGGTSPIATAMLEALRVELRTRTSEGESPEALIEIARLRFVRPMEIVRELVLAHASAPAPAAAALASLLDAIGTTFWWIDELIDISTDLRRGSLNSIAVLAGGRPTRKPEPGAIRALAKRLRTDRAVEHARTELQANVARVSEILKSEAFSPSATARLRAVFSAYARAAVE